VTDPLIYRHHGPRESLAAAAADVALAGILLTAGRGSMVIMRRVLISMSTLIWTTASANAEWSVLAQPMKLSCGPVSKTTTGCGSEALIGDSATSQVIVCNADYQLTAKSGGVFNGKVQHARCQKLGPVFSTPGDYALGAVATPSPLAGTSFFAIWAVGKASGQVRVCFYTSGGNRTGDDCRDADIQ
jgi:hypothetical protein